MSPVRHHFEDQPIPQVIHFYDTQPPSPTSSQERDYSPTASETASVVGCPIGIPFTRDDELWFEDGNIVLNTGGVEFCVYKGPLLTLSPILKAQCAHLGYKSLRDTSSEDLRHVLRFVYGGTSRYVQFPF